MFPVLAALGRRLAARRHDKKLSQEDLAVKAGLSAKFISSVERGGVNPSISSAASARDGNGRAPRHTPWRTTRLAVRRAARRSMLCQGRSKSAS